MFTEIGTCTTPGKWISRALFVVLWHWNHLLCATDCQMKFFSWERANFSKTSNTYEIGSMVQCGKYRSLFVRKIDERATETMYTWLVHYLCLQYSQQYLSLKLPVMSTHWESSWQPHPPIFTAEFPGRVPFSSRRRCPYTLPTQVVLPKSFTSLIRLFLA